MSKIFDSNVIEIVKDKLTFHFINIENYDEAFKSFINNKIVSIYDSTFDEKDIELVKIQIKEWLDEKGADENKKAGFVAEFMCHLYINYLKFEQHFLFSNLEEKGSMKKGFDGLYKLDNEMWIYESKSSIATTKTADHNSNIGEAYRDVKAKLNGTKTNKFGNPISPWDNAVHHAEIAKIKDNKTLIENLKEFRNRFIKKDFENIKNFNVIPSSTIFLEDRYSVIDNDDLKDKLEKLIKKYDYKKMNVLCINKKSVNDFIGYINEV
ncbi:hypothetical protein D3M61_02170 [Aliarcobacter butzleri]|uniref:Anti-bacteriophage protein A/HamA C-terminal domain-containing protein n=1 Tax=Aliarcobacter butzleri TaxID=28197 RepID=A0AAW7Q1V6_9BACT|nr:hypothetical protein [Aliarcobacter butzleri]MDN5113052.1 hypothetical protein [Aliarcobacter butzleri]RZV14785.1 hypothetical protein D3M61_02170 [Aliarcobacter butzleri]